MVKKKLLWLLIVLGAIVSAPVSAQLTIEITRGVDNPTVIAVSPMLPGSGSLDEDISAIISANLERSGLFNPVSRDHMLSYPRNQDEVFYRDWRVLGVQYLAFGRVERQEDGRLRVVYGLSEVLGERNIFTRVVRGRERNLRDIAHHISDEIYETITGLRGVFSTRIAYISVQQGDDDRQLFRLMVSDADGQRPRMLLESREPLLSPAWSPDGRELVYVSFESGRPAIYRQRLSDARREKVTSFRGLNGAPSWSPDGRSLALVLSKDGNPELYTLDLESGKFTRRTNHFAIDTEPTWTPDGKSLIFTSDRGGTPQIYKLTLASGEVERITFRGSYNARPRLAPDGRTLVMVHRDEGPFHIASRDLKTGDFRILSSTRLDESPTVAPNGAMVLYATKRNGKGVLAAVSIDAGVKFYLPSREGDVREPAWSPFL